MTQLGSIGSIGYMDVRNSDTNDNGKQYLSDELQEMKNINDELRRVQEIEELHDKIKGLTIEVQLMRNQIEDLESDSEYSENQLIALADRMVALEDHKSSINPADKWRF